MAVCGVCGGGGRMKILALIYFFVAGLGALIVPAWLHKSDD
jgi:uncharacterized membrane protein YedE/YeeE